jgi:predicted unusual protein kinase regulating ubiquinone biosynthesis (AarF/ABC1/UbiB family)
MEHLFRHHCRGFRTGADVGAVLRASLSAVREHGVRIDGRFATAVVNLLCIEAFATALDPSYSVLDHSELMLRAHAALGPQALGGVLHAAAPALAAYGAARDALTWRLPHALRTGWRLHGQCVADTGIITRLQRLLQRRTQRGIINLLCCLKQRVISG